MRLIKHNKTWNFSNIGLPGPRIRWLETAPQWGLDRHSSSNPSSSASLFQVSFATSYVSLILAPWLLRSKPYPKLLMSVCIGEKGSDCVTGFKKGANFWNEKTNTIAWRVFRSMSQSSTRGRVIQKSPLDSKSESRIPSSKKGSHRLISRRFLFLYAISFLSALAGSEFMHRIYKPDLVCCRCCCCVHDIFFSCSFSLVCVCVIRHWIVSHSTTRVIQVMRESN